MTSRERVTRAVTFSGPDRVPIMHGFMPGALRRYGQRMVDLFQRYADDFGVAAGLRAPDPNAEPPMANSTVDEWGVTWETLTNVFSVGQPRGYPLADWSALADYRVPAVPDPDWFAERGRALEASGRQHCALAGGFTLFERLQQLRGMEHLFYDLMEDRPEIHDIADRITDWNVRYIEGWGGAGWDAVHLADDWGSQTQMLTSPALWRSFFKPRYALMVEAAHRFGMHVHFHTDGYIMEIIPDFIEIGVDVLNPQHECMGRDRVAALTAGEVCIRSDLDRQYVLPHGTPEQVRRHVREVVDAFGRHNGGLIGHGEIGPDVPLENAEAMLDEFYSYGRY